MNAVSQTGLLTDDFDFPLPPERIAQAPAEPRDSARLLHVTPQKVFDRTMRDLPDLLHKGDLLVMNNTKVIPARLYGKRGAMNVEILLHKKKRRRSGALSPNPANGCARARRFFLRAGFCRDGRRET